MPRSRIIQTLPIISALYAEGALSSAIDGRGIVIRTPAGYCLPTVQLIIRQASRCSIALRGRHEPDSDGQGGRSGFSWSGTASTTCGHVARPWTLVPAWREGRLWRHCSADRCQRACRRSFARLHFHRLPLLPRRLPTEPGGMHCINLYFRCVCSGEVVLNQESSEYAWVPSNEMGTYDLAFRNDEGLRRFWSMADD